MHSVASLNLRRGDSNQSAPRLPRRASFTFPERFKDGEDADQDVTAPSSKRQRYMNQSFLSMIANVGSNIPPEPQAALGEKDAGAASAAGTRSKFNTSQSVAGLGVSSASRHREVDPSERVGQRMIQSTYDLGAQRRPNRRPRKSRLAHVEEDMASSQILPPREEAPQVLSAQREDEHPESPGGEDGQADSHSSDDVPQSSHGSETEEEVSGQASESKQEESEELQ